VNNHPRLLILVATSVEAIHPYAYRSVIEKGRVITLYIPREVILLTDLAASVLIAIR
jgi:hypothetical protein